MIIALLNDLFFSAKIQSTASLLKKKLVIVSTKEDFMSKLNQNHETIHKIIIDINFSKFDIFELLKEIDTDDIYLIGYLSHVQIELKEKANKVFDLVLPQSDFSQRLPELLQLHDH